MFVSDLEVLTGNIQWRNLQLCERVGNLHKALPLEKNNNLNPSNSAYLVTGKINSSLQWQTAWDGRWGHVVHCLNKQSLPPICTAFCSFCAVTEQRIVFLQQQERNSRSGKLHLPGIFTDFCPGPAPSFSKYLIPISSVNMSILSTLPESLETEKESAPNHSKCGMSSKKQTARDLFLFLFFEEVGASHITHNLHKPLTSVTSSINCFYIPKIKPI